MLLIGAICGLVASLCWAVASVFYTRVPIGAGAMTTLKNCAAAALLGVVLVCWRIARGEPIIQASVESCGWLAISGIIGLALCDIAYFRSIQILGAQRGVTLTLLTAPTTALAGMLILREQLTTPQWLAILATLLGIALVIRERRAKAPEQEIRPGSETWGIACAGIAIVGTAIGSVLMKKGTVGTAALEATVIRLLSAGIFGVLISLGLGHLSEIKNLLKDHQGVRRLSIATTIGTVFGVWLMLIAFKYCPSGIAATMTSTTPLFVIPVVYVLLGQRVSKRSLAGAFVAFAGVAALLRLS